MSTLSKICEISATLNSKETGIKKSGKVSIGNTVLYRYYELSDFLPTLLEEFNKNKLAFKINYLKDRATLEICNEDKTDIETFEIYYNENITNPLPAKGKNPLQQMGELMTYVKRYLLVNAFNLCDDDSTEQLQNVRNYPEDRNQILGTQDSLTNEQKNTCLRVAQEITEICNKANSTQKSEEKRTLINKGFKIIKQHGEITQQAEPLRTAIMKLKKLYFEAKGSDSKAVEVKDTERQAVEIKASKKGE